MEQEELDQLLQVMENPLRRKIIKRLSQGPTYAFQLAKELQLGQPLVAKHMKVMEDAGFVNSETEISPSGPRRKKYSLAKSISITMDLAPNTYVERGVALEVKPRRRAESQSNPQLWKRLGGAMNADDDRERLTLLSQVLNDVDERMNSLEGEHADLVQIRNQAMEAAAEIANKLDELDKRRVLFHILDEHDREVESISEALELREAAVKGILEELEREFFG
jgi:predicted transcriptional regulator